MGGGLLALGLGVISWFLFCRSALCSEGMKVSRPSNVSIFGTCVVDDKIQIAVGDMGKIFRTEDGGTKWESLPNQVFTPLYCARLAGDGTVFVSGAVGAIFKSVDKGKTFQRLETGTTKHLFSMAFYDESHGIACGDWSEIVRTEDGGRTWQKVSWEGDVFLYGACYASRTHAWIVGENGAILRSTDGGKSWNQMDVGVASSLTSVEFRDERRGFITGIDGVLLETEDGGDSWKEVANPSPNHIYAVKCAGDVCMAVGDFAQVMERASNTWKPWPMPKDLTVTWLTGLDLKVVNQRVVMVCGGRRGLLIHNEWKTKP